jgi:hypothetical protein
MARYRGNHSKIGAAIIHGACFFVFGTGFCTADTVEFAPVDQSEEVQQSRTFENTSLAELASACTSVIQDIKFNVTETESNPVLIVAHSPMLFDSGSHHRQTRYTRSNYSGPHDRVPDYTLSVSLQAAGTRGTDYRVRLALGYSYEVGGRFRERYSPHRTDFYQQFFGHLNRALHRTRALP